MTQEESGTPKELGKVSGNATEACSRKIAQQAAHCGAIDVRSFVVGGAQQLPDGRDVIQLLVVTNYRRKGGVEKRTALVDCTVNQYGRVAIAEANRLGVIAVRAVNSVDPSPPGKPSKPNQWNECIERAGAKALWLAASAKRYSDMRQDGRVPEN